MVSVLGFAELPDYVRPLLWHTLFFVSCWTFSPSFNPLAEDLLIISWSYILFIVLASLQVCRLSHTSATQEAQLVFVRSLLLLFLFRSLWNLVYYKLQLNPSDHWPTWFFFFSHPNRRGSVAARSVWARQRGTSHHSHCHDVRSKAVHQQWREEAVCCNQGKPKNREHQVKVMVRTYTSFWLQRSHCE